MSPSAYCSSNARVPNNDGNGSTYVYVCLQDQTPGSGLHVRFTQPARAITPQQELVMYDGDICLGSAPIWQHGTTQHEKDTAECGTHADMAMAAAS